MRNGYRIFDADTHFHASAETLEPFLDPMLRDMKDELQTREFRTGWAGEEMPEPYTHLYRLGSEGGWGAAPPRILGEAGPRPNAQRHFQNFQGFTFPTPGGSDWDADARVRDMDEEGVDVHLMVPGAASGHPDPAVDMAMLRSVHRQIDDMCSRHPGTAQLAHPRHSAGRGGLRAGDQALRGLAVGEGRLGEPAGRLPRRPPGPAPHLGSSGRRRAHDHPSQLRDRLPRATATSGTTRSSDARRLIRGARCG